MSKFTEGPWSLHPAYPGYKVVANYQETEGSATYSDIATISRNTDLQNGDRKANACLIVEAPIMHKELNRVKEFLEDNEGWILDRADSGDESCFVLFNEFKAVLERVNKLLNKIDD